MRQHAFWIMLGIAACCPAGCGPNVKLVEVTGKVTYNGNPPNDEGCNIVFLGPNGKQVTAPIAPSGEYKATGVVAGANKVAIYYRNPAATQTRDPGEKAPPSTSLLRNLPSIYADVKTSELKVEVDTGAVYNVELKGPDLGAAAAQKAGGASKKKEHTDKGKPHKKGPT
jgi:hypothetical protein